MATSGKPVIFCKIRHDQQRIILLGDIYPGAPVSVRVSSRAVHHKEDWRIVGIAGGHIGQYIQGTSVVQGIILKHKTAFAFGDE